MVAACGERAKCIPMIALAACNHIPPTGLAFLYEILARKFQRGLGCFRSARDKIDTIEVARRSSRQPVRENFCRLGGIESRMRKRDTVKLVDNGLFNARIRMTQAGDRSTTAGIEIFFPSVSKTNTPSPRSITGRVAEGYR
jgi:hypothetical protein